MLDILISVAVASPLAASLVEGQTIVVHPRTEPSSDTDAGVDEAPDENNQPRRSGTASPAGAGGSVSAFTVSQAMERTPTGWSVSLGASGSTGDFGSAGNTTLWSVPLGLRYTRAGLRLSASLPYMRIRSDGVLFTGIDGSPLVVATSFAQQRTVRAGLGDLTLGASYLLLTKQTLGVDVDLTGRVKLPTASASSKLSTGKADFAGGTELSRVMGRVTPFASVTYRIFGDKAPWHIRNGFSASGGASVTMTAKTTLIVSYDYAEAATSVVENSHELFLGLSSPLPRSALRVTGFGTIGLSRGAPALSSGLSATMGF